MDVELRYKVYSTCGFALAGKCQHLQHRGINSRRSGSCTAEGPWGGCSQPANQKLASKALGIALHCRTAAALQSLLPNGGSLGRAWIAPAFGSMADP